jgi:predicted ATPase
MPSWGGAAALRQYQLCAGVLRRELGVEPEAETTQLYEEILHRRPALAPTSATPSGGSPSYGALHGTALPLAADIALIGREPEMTRLRQALALAMAGGGQLVTVLGEAGVGKSRLTAEFALEVLRADGHVLLGRCYEGEQILPLGPWVDALRAAGIAGDRSALRGLGAPWRAELARLLPELRSGPAAAGPLDPLKLFEAVARFLVHAASGAPVAVILEDVHWADEMSLRLLGFLGRRLGRWPLLLVTTFRSDEMADARVLRRMLEGLDRDGSVTRIALAPLSYADTSALVRLLGRPGNDEATLAWLCEQVWRTSEGNPFVIVESMRAREQGTRDARPAGLALPGRVRDVIAARLDRLGARTVDLMAVAAVIGRDFDMSLLQGAAGIGESEAAEGLEELVGRQVIRPIGDRFEFTHDRVRDVAYTRLLPARRKLLHRQIAQAIERQCAAELERHHPALGLHYRESEVWARAVAHFRQAGINALARSASREAVASFEQALLALGRLPSQPETVELAVDLHLDLHEALRPLGDLEKLSRALAEAEARARALNDQKRWGRIWSARTQYFRMVGDPRPAIESGRRALEHACRVSPYEDLPAPLDAPRSCLGRAYALVGRLDEAMPLLEGASEPAPMYQRPRNLTYLGETLLLGGRPADARSTVERALHLCRAHGQRGFEADALHVLGDICSHSEPARAERVYRGALAIATELGMRPLVAHCHAGLARLCRAQPERVRRHARTAAAMFREMGMQFWLEKLAAENSMLSSGRRSNVAVPSSG